VERSRADSRESRFEEALDWQIGRVSVANFSLTVNGHALALGAGGWEMRGFIGNDKALKAALGFGVDLNGFSGGLGIAAKMVKDSSKQAVKKGVRGFTGKTECAWHPPPRHEMRAAAPRQFPPHEARHAARADEFGDLSKAAANKVGDAIAVGSEKVGKAIKVGVTGFTGKQEYEFGDVSKAAAKKVGAPLATSRSVARPWPVPRVSVRRVVPSNSGRRARMRSASGGTKPREFCTPRCTAGLTESGSSRLLLLLPQQQSAAALIRKLMTSSTAGGIRAATAPAAHAHAHARTHQRRRRR